MRRLAKVLILVGSVSAAGAAHAATQTIKNAFDFSWSQGATPPFTTSYTLVQDSPEFTASFDTSLGTLTALDIHWTNLELTMQGIGKPQALGFGITVPAVLAGVATGETTVNGTKTGGLAVGDVQVGGTARSLMALDAFGKDVERSFTATSDVGGIFAEAAKGGKLDISWNTGAIRTFPGSALPTSVSGLIFYGIKTQAKVSPAAELSGDLIVSFDYAPTAIPEPATWGMLLAGFAGLGLAGRRTVRTARSAIV